VATILHLNLAACLPRYGLPPSPIDLVRGERERRSWKVGLICKPVFPIEASALGE
jgi:hypothetical protein